MPAFDDLEAEVADYFDREVAYPKYPRSKFRTFEAKFRAMTATILARAISECHPDDARTILTAALLDLSAGLPSGHVFGSTREDAQFWSKLASPAELVECLGAALHQLRDRPMHMRQRKELFVSLWNSFPKDDRQKFLAQVQNVGSDK